MAQQAGGGIDPAPRAEDRPRPHDRRAPGAVHLTDRQLLEEAVLRLRQLGPLIEAAERHPLIRGLLRRIDPNGSR